MNKKFKTFLVNPWTISIGSPLLVALLFAIIDSIKENIFIGTSIINIIHIVIKLIIKILNYAIPVWIVLICIVLFILTLKLVSKYLKKRNTGPDWLSFTNMIYKNWNLAWEYRNRYNQYTIDKIHPICSCGCKLSYDYDFHGSILRCPNCDNVYPLFTSTDNENAGKIIEHKIKTNKYKKID